MIVMQVWFDSHSQEAYAARRQLFLKCPQFLTRPLNPEEATRFQRFAPIEAIAGVPLWKAPDGGHIFEWAIDYVTCRDRRWTLFGPFTDDAAALEGYAALELCAKQDGCGTRGFRLFNEHCVVSCLRGDITNMAPAPEGRQRQWPRSMWTDG